MDILTKLSGRSATVRRHVHRRIEARHWETVRRGLTLQAFKVDGEPLPPGYGAGCTERVVEFPWALTRLSGSTILDAGSTFNHAPLIPHFQGRKLTIATLAPEPANFIEAGVSYTFTDLRDLPFRDDTFDQTLCISVLEHVGMDNTRYGANTPLDAPRDAARAALTELLRVTRGQLLVTVPFGVRSNMGWQRQFDREDIAHLLDGTSHTVEFYARQAAWQKATEEQAAGAVYGNGAAAVACITIR